MIRLVICVASLVVCICKGGIAQEREFADSSGQFKLMATLDRLDGEMVVLKLADGTAKQIPLKKLSERDQSYVREWLELRKRTAPKKAFAPVSPEQLQLAITAETILKKHCYDCHGNQGSNEGGFNFVLDVRRLSSGNHYVYPKSAAQSLISERMVKGEMPPAGVEPRPSQSEIDDLKKWIAAGAPDWNTNNDRPFIAVFDTEKLIQADLQKFNPRERRFQRYFSLANLFNSGSSQDELQTYRIAFAKLINSLSWNKEVIVPQTIDPNTTLFRVDLREANWAESSWTKILSTYPYAFVSQEDMGKYFVENTGTAMPHIRIDWFVAKASEPPLYHALLEVPETVKELEDLLRVDVATNIQQGKAKRAGFNRSGISQNNRLIERHESAYGSYWKSYDFGANVGRKNLFEHPAGPSSDKGAFEQDGGEMIFTLPNGFQGYMLTNANGKRLDRGPTEIVTDPGRPDRTVTNGISCMSCHFNGVIEKEDEIRKHVEANQSAFPEADDLLEMYCTQNDMSRLFQEDRLRFESSLRKIGLLRPTRTGEPISNMSRRFETELDVNQACAELGITPESFSESLATNPGLSRSVGQLNVPGQTIKRDAFVEMFGDLVVEFKLGIRISPNGKFKLSVSGDASGGFGKPFAQGDRPKSRGDGQPKAKGQGAEKDEEESDDENRDGAESDDSEEGKYSDEFLESLKAKAKIQVRWGRNSWRDATIVRKVSKFRFEVNFDGWENKIFNEIVAPDVIRLR